MTIERIGYEGREEEYMLILDDCIDRYKTFATLHFYFVVTYMSAFVALGSTIVGVLLGIFIVKFEALINEFITLFLKYVNENITLAAVFLIFSVTFLFVTVIMYVIFLVVMITAINFFSRRFNVDKWFGLNRVSDDFSILDSLYLAKYEPEKWDLLIGVDRDNKEIRFLEIKASDKCSA